MIIVLDSNVFTADFHMEGNNFKLLLDFLNRTDSKLAIPKIVVLEVKHNFLSELQHAQIKIEQVIANLKERIGNVRLDNPLTNDCLEQEYQLYSESFDKKLMNINAEILEYPDVSHQAIVERAVHKRKPFKPNGDGYRDTLIWESVLGLLQGQEKPVAFVTKDTDDFCDRVSGSYCLHDDLKMDIVQRKIPNDKLTFYSDLKMLIEYIVLPNFEKREDLREKILRRQYPFENLDKIILSKLSAVMNSYDSVANELYFEKEFERPHFWGMGPEGELEVKDIRRISQQQIYISMEMFSPAYFEGLVRKNNFGQKHAYFHFYPSDDDIRYFKAIELKILKIDLNMLFSNQTNNIVSVEIENVEEI